MIKQNKIDRSLTVADFVRRLFLSWILAVLTEYLILPGELKLLETTKGLEQMSLIRVAAITVGITLVLSVISRFANTAKAERWFTVGAFAALCTVTLIVQFNKTFLYFCIFVLAVLVVFALFGYNKSGEAVFEIQAARKSRIWITAGLTAVFFLFVCAWTVGRFYSFCTPSYDFGIFSQMFFNMKEQGLPITTIERDGALSHFAVHVSPVYYLMLPFYWLVPSPVTLQVLQAAVVASSVIPLWKIGKHHGLSDTQRMLVCAVLLLCPVLSGGTSYDLHENCFLTPLILWLFYGIDTKKISVTLISALLVLSVKEDAPVYVAVIGLWLVVRALVKFKKSDTRELITGIVLLVGSVGWFLLVTQYLARYGDGVMSNRYDNLMYGGSDSLFTVVKAVILNPIKALYECADPEKLFFIRATLLPLLGLPLITRRYDRYILLIPYVLVNLMSDYIYQYDIFKQYTFGSNAFLIYLTVVNLVDLKITRRQICVLLSAVIVSGAYFCTTALPKGMSYPGYVIEYSTYYQNIRDTLDTIPDGASVGATTFYTTYLSQREVLYDVRYCSLEHLLGCEYIVLDASTDRFYEKFASDGEENGYENLVSLLKENGYTEYDSFGDNVQIWHK